MEFRQLGKDGPQVPVIGLGAWPIGGGMGHVDEDNGIDTIHAAIDSGITLLDTAQGYRTSESIVGRALKNGYRDKAFIATKVSGNYRRSDIRAAIENSLRAMQVDYVDLYQIHGLKAGHPIEESIDEMTKLQQEGKTRFIGVSNYKAEHMQQALNVARFQSNQPRYHMFSRQIEEQDIPFCRREGIGILAHTPLAKGMLAGKYTPETTFPPEDERSKRDTFKGDKFRRFLEAIDQLRPIAAEKGLTMVQLAIAWDLRLPEITCVLVGAKNPQQVHDYLGAVGVSFTPDELDRIDAILAAAPQDWA